jgi:lipopolysaccharide/colanic/teichoic acid biosynthesis glycosyltransferase
LEGPVQPASKRIFDMLLAVAGMLFSTPVWLAALFLIWFEDPGPVLFVKNSVGKGGINFHQYKFRTMVREAEVNTGPILASDTMSDPDDRALVAKIRSG